MYFQRATQELAEITAEPEKLYQSCLSTAAKLKAGLVDLGFKTAWPLQKDNAAMLAAHVSTCHGGLIGAIAVLSFSIGVAHLDRLQGLDNKIVEDRSSLKDVLRNVESSVQGV